jgi:ParB-like chromosome segregation protein Spo0J
MGERRWRAAQMAGLTELDAVVSHGVEEGARETLARQVAENVGRADMTAMEEAKSFKRLADAEYTVDEIAEMCGKSASYVGWRIDLLRLCEPAQEALGKGHLPVGMAWYVSQLSPDNQLRFLGKYARGAFANDRDAEAFVKAARAEEQRRESQGSFFVLADEETSAKDVQDALPGAHDVPEEERERIIADRAKLTKKIDRLSTAGEILSELATADPEELATLLAGVGGGVAGHVMRVEHLRALTTKVIKNLREAQAIAAVRTGGIVVNPEAAA